MAVAQINSKPTDHEPSIYAERNFYSQNTGPIDRVHIAFRSDMPNVIPKAVFFARKGETIGPLLQNFELCLVFIEINGSRNAALPVPKTTQMYHLLPRLRHKMNNERNTHPGCFVSRDACWSSVRISSPLVVLDSFDKRDGMKL